ncbi:Eco57I restriction-modification methylase domain-containing protein [Deinococcus alpinitundrae]|uniref:Eco57I restriction-modification methylase domain-containing protein n=1 Tax=Deinococcus alpinitundrae TaxID=468913 RepID=UPI00137AB84E|nr:type IIL restriction-modification enzyme MmeI [Deinococcus alpinitundrae]
MTWQAQTEAAREWLPLVEISGVYLAPKVLDEAFPQSLDPVATAARQRARSAWEEWRDAVDDGDPRLPDLHREWVNFVLGELLEYPGHLLQPVEDGDGAWSRAEPESGDVARPVWLMRRGTDAPKVAVFVLPPDRSLHRASKAVASPLDRATAWCRAEGVRSALLTDGEQWTLLDAPEGAVSGHVTWHARLWWLEPVTLRAFYTFLNARTVFGRPETTFPALVDRSLEFKEEVTTTLGTQVERAVEVLVRALDRADRDTAGTLLRDVSERELYEAGLTVMMRLVFVLSAEERGLLLLGEPVWDGYYAVSTLRSQLEEVDDRDGHGVLERRFDAWSRLLAVFRAVYGGVDHETLRLPALGGSLFDPDRFPFLEGRAAGTSWRDMPAEPLPIDNRTVLLLLDALQRIRIKDVAQTLSYRALDVEQIGHVYEGLLERTVSRVADVTLGLDGTGKSKTPDVLLTLLESARLDGREQLLTVAAELTGRTTPSSKATLARILDRAPTDDLKRRLRRACGSDALARRILPFANLLRTDPWDEPVVYPKEAFAVTSGTDRSTTGAHYTPKALTERIVGTTLEPLAYVGPAEGLPREEWRLRSAVELLDLKICDPAMGSGAFLVQVCRWLGDRVVRAWLDAETDGRALTADGDVVPDLDGREAMTTDPEERLLQARRLVAERCLYGVDINPVAVELAKLSVWLVTLARNRPFGFLDHNLRHGDSLLGLRDLEQLTELSMTPSRGAGQRIFSMNVREAVDRAVALRTRLRALPIRDIRDVEAMARLDLEARAVLRRPELAADALIGEAMCHVGSAATLTAALNTLSSEVGKMTDGDTEGEQAVKRRADAALAVDLSDVGNPRRPFHWPLEFPEVFLRENAGFDAFVGNPPFLGGQKITGAMGTAFREYLVQYLAGGRKGSADLVTYFFLSCFGLLRNGGTSGLLAVNTIAEGDTRDVGLTALLNEGAVIFEAHPNEPWPGAAAVVTSRIHLIRGDWNGIRNLSGDEVDLISSFLTAEDDKRAFTLEMNSDRSYQGAIVLGDGFILESREALDEFIRLDRKNAEIVHPYLSGDDLNSNFTQIASRWAIAFWDWPLNRESSGSWTSLTEAQKRSLLRQGTVPSDFPGKAASDYPVALARIKELVLPERAKKNDRGAREKWWKYYRISADLYHSIGNGHHFYNDPPEWTSSRNCTGEVIAFATQATKYPVFEFCSNKQIFANSLGIITLFDYAHYATLNSNFHTVWAWKYSSSLETRMRYTPTDCFETFPFPVFGADDALFALGERLRAARRAGHEAFEVGLTDLYNLLHDPGESAPEIVALREAHVAVDERVKSLYGFDDINLEHGFHDVTYLPATDCTRFTVSEAARLELLRRLAALNVERYEAEQAAVSLPKKVTPKAASKRGQTTGEGDLFAFSTPSAAPEDVGKSVLEVLKGRRRWFGKTEILQESGLPQESWKAVMDGLLASGAVEKEGEKRGTRYRART